MSSNINTEKLLHKKIEELEEEIISLNKKIELLEENNNNNIQINISKYNHQMINPIDNIDWNSVHLY